MGLYASNTQVSSDQSKGEIERILQRYGADEFVTGWDQKRAVVMFRMNNRRIRFYLPMPARDEYKETESGRSRTSDYTIDEAWEQAKRQRWRALALAIKAKLEAVASGITSFEEEFMAHVVMPNGKNFGEWAVPQIAESYAKKAMPPLLESG
jgi:hypothetical protein